MILATQRERDVTQYLRAHRRKLRPVVEIRCRGDGRLLGAVYPLRDEFWTWHLGERYSPDQYREEAGIMMELDPHESGDASGICSEGETAEDAQARSSGRQFPDGILQLVDPAAVYGSHSREQVLTAYPSGPLASCVKCRSTYVMDPLAIGYATGEWLASGARKPGVVLPARVSHCGDRGHDCEDHMTGDIPWNLAGAWQRARGAVSSSATREDL